jgi:hypothetical protein
MMGMEKKPLEVRPRFSNSGKENVELVRNQLADSAGVEEAILFVALARKYREDMESGGMLDEHPLTLAARRVGAAVHWVI